MTIHLYEPIRPIVGALETDQPINAEDVRAMLSVGPPIMLECVPVGDCLVLSVAPPYRGMIHPDKMPFVVNPIASEFSQRWIYGQAVIGPRKAFSFDFPVV